MGAFLAKAGVKLSYPLSKGTNVIPFSSLSILFLPNISNCSSCYLHEFLTIMTFRLRFFHIVFSFPFNRWCFCKILGDPSELLCAFLIFTLNRVIFFVSSKSQRKLNLVFQCFYISYHYI